MHRTTLLLVCLLVLTNGVWAFLAVRDEDRSAAEADLRDQVRGLEARVEQLRAAQARPGAGPALEGAGERPAAMPPGTAAAPPAADEEAARRQGEIEEARLRREAEARRHAQEAERSLAAQARAEAAKARVLQVRDPAEREAGLRDLAEMLRSRDPGVVKPVLGVFYDLRGVEYDHEAFRPLVWGQLDSDDVGVRVTAAYALYHVKREAGDLDRILELARDPEEGWRFAHIALMFNGNKVDGALADVFVRLLADEDLDHVRSVANSLRGMRSTTEVQAAVADAWRRHQATGARRGLWFHILGQMRPFREPTLRAIFEALGGPEARQEGGLLTRRLDRDIEEADRPLAARLAADLVGKSTVPRIRRTALEVLRAYGGADQVGLVEGLARNEMLPEDERTLARSVADEIARR